MSRHNRFKPAHLCIAEDEHFKSRILVLVDRNAHMREVFTLIQSMGSNDGEGLGQCAAVLSEITSIDRVTACLRTRLRTR